MGQMDWRSSGAASSAPRGEDGVTVYECALHANTRASTATDAFSWFDGIGASIRTNCDGAWQHFAGAKVSPRPPR